MTCPHCPHCNPELVAAPPTNDDGVLDERRLRAHCITVGISLLPGGMVWEADAAVLMGVRPRTLKNRRSLRDPALPRYEIRGKARRAVYSLAAIADSLVQQR